MTVKLNGTTILNHENFHYRRSNDGRKSNMHFVATQTIEKLEKHR